MISPKSGYTSDNKSSAAFSSLNQVRIKWLRSTVLSGRLNDAQLWRQLEFERVKAEGQSLSYGLQGRFLEAPKMKESSQARQAA